MLYSANYTDENGEVRTIQITQEDSIEALKNDYEAVCRKYDPRRVTIQRLPAKVGEELHLQITVHAPSHYLDSSTDTSPKPCDSMSAEIICFLGYPLVAVSASYAPDHYLASPNVFRFGGACIDNWIPCKSSILTVVDKLVHDMIHDPNVTRYESVANSTMVQWHKDGVASGAFPTIQPKLLYAPDATTALPPRRAAVRPAVAPPSLPSRRH